MQRPGRFLLYLLVAAHVAAGAAMIALAFGSDMRVRTPDFGWQERWLVVTSVIGFSFGQSALATWWAVMGRSLNWSARSAVLLGVCMLWARVIAAVTDAPAWMGWTLQVGLAVTMLWVLVPWRLWHDAQQRALTSSQAGVVRPWQFELRGLMLIVLAAACTFAVAQWCLAAGGTQVARHVWPFAVAGAVMSLVVLWGGASKRTVLRRCVTVATTVTAVMLLMQWRDDRHADWWFYPVVFGSETIVVTATLAVLKVAARQPAFVDARQCEVDALRSSGNPQLG
ncbi:MAG: hypothetical protein KDA63_21400 [Planctomycetales bacterium]|nr:hypothetical protein [Planctomycetales bacterium]